MEALSTAVLLAVVVKAVLDRLAEPLRLKFPQLDLWWFDYLSMIFGGLAAWFAGINLFSGHFSNATLGLILTAACVGGGANLLNAVFTNATTGLTQHLTAAFTPRDWLTPAETAAGVTVVPRPRGW